MRSNWEYKKIGDICTVERGGSPRPIDDYITDDPDGINWIKIGDTTDSMFITSTAQKIIPEGAKKSRYVQPGDFLLSNSMSFGRPYILKIDGCIHDGWLVLRDNEGLFDKRFLYYCLSAKPTYEKFIMMAVGGVVNNLNSEMVRKVEVPVPPITEQIEIADLLDKANSMIEKRKQQLSALDDLIKARFVEMFGEPFDTSRWEMKELKDLSESMVDGSNVDPTYYEPEGKVLFLRIQNVWRNEFRLADSVYITPEINRTLYYDTSLKKGDLLITKIGRYYTKDSSLGRVSVYLGENDCANYSNNIMRVRLKDSVDSEFVNALLNLDEYQSFIKRTSKGGTDKRALSKSLIGSYPIIVPPTRLQKEFIGFIKQVDKSKDAIKKSLAETQTLFDSLMQQYFG